MNRTTVGLAGLLALVAAHDVYQFSTGREIEIRETAPDLLLASATQACRDEIAQAPTSICEPCRVDIPTPATRWCCGGAVMPARVQSCLTAARAVVIGEAEPIEEEGPPP